MELVPEMESHIIALTWFNSEPNENTYNDMGLPIRRRIIDAYLLIKDDLDLSPLYKALREENDV